MKKSIFFLNALWSCALRTPRKKNCSIFYCSKSMIPVHFLFFSLFFIFPCVSARNTTHYYYEFDFPNRKTCFIFGLWSKFNPLYSVRFVYCLFGCCCCHVWFRFAQQQNECKEQERNTQKRLSGVSVLSFSFEKKRRNESNEIVFAAFLFTTTKNLPAYRKKKK